MRRREPPPLATWMLRHLTAGERDEALDGDLLEVFRQDRSSAWYYRQVVAACVVSWWRSIRARGSVLVFALLWSMLSPAWYLLIERIEASPKFAEASDRVGLFWLPIALIGWIVIHAAFLWGGLLVYRLVHRVLGKPLQRADFRKAFWTVPLILPPVYGLCFLLATLYWYSLPGLSQAHLPASLLGQIFDLGLLATFIRVPYFIALVVALWGTVQPFRRDENLLADYPSRWAPASPEQALEEAAVPRFLAFMVAAGLINSMIVALLLCSLPDAHAEDLPKLFGSALKFVVIATLGGVLGSWLYWRSPASPLREGSPVPFSVFALTCAAGWVWVPAMMLFAQQVSGVTAFVAMIGSFLLATGLKRATYAVFASNQLETVPWEECELFAVTLYRPPLELHGYLIALGIFAAGAALARQSNYTAAAMLAMSASIFGWKSTVPRRASGEIDVRMKRAAMRAGFAAVPAILLTMWALMDGLAHQNEGVQASDAAVASARASRLVPADAKTPIATAGVSGYQSVVLWPYPEKKEIVPPILMDDSILAPGTKRPLIIRFDGPYWFLQPPSKQPGRDAHVAQGTPVSVDVESNNAVALVMNAHQKLSRSIPVARCREIEIGIQNRDNREGIVSLGVLLSDEEGAQKRTYYLGEQPILSSVPGHFFQKTVPQYETLRFAVPAGAPLRRFNEITVMFLPDIEHAFVAPKMAIQQFELFPR